MAPLFGKKNIETNSNNESRIQALIDENEKLQLNISKLLAKIASLESQTEELQKIVAELQEKKNALAESLEKMERLQKEKDDAIAMAMHDIKNPAGTIQNLITLLESYDLNVAEQNEIHKSLMKISSRLVRIVEEVATTVHRTKVALNVNFSKSNLNKIAENVVERYIHVGKAKRIEVITNFSEKLSDVELDEDKIDEVIENLINNAIKFSPKDSKVHVKTRQDDNYVIFEVIDKGPGLSEEEVKMAFEKGSQLSAQPTGGESSSGLGLWIVQRIISEHHGKVWVKSKKGNGSTFSFRIPVKQNKEKSD